LFCSSLSVTPPARCEPISTSLHDALPIYVMIKQYERGIGAVCSFASYEKQHFWDLLSRSDVPIHRESVIAWAYPPYDSRVTQTGDPKSTHLNSTHDSISYAVFCLRAKNNQ